jgi:muramoyltetrapeptide carboxypeptidase
MHTSSNTFWPRALDPESRIALIAPAGPLRGEYEVVQAEARIADFGWQSVRGAHLLDRAGYLAGTDGDRLADLQWALDDDAIDAVWCMRGGYGMTRILPHLSLTGFAQNPKAVIGYSDITALHCAIARHAPTVSFHAPVGRASLPPMGRRSLHAALTHGDDPCGLWLHAAAVREGVVTGQLAGGNLSLLAALCGTPWALQARGAIVILEDVHEPAYRIDRMLRQLEQAGTFVGCVGLAVGQFTDIPADEAHDALTTDALIHDLADRLAVPCLANLPIGHIADQWTIPLGATAMLDVAARSLRTQPASPVASISRAV